MKGFKDWVIYSMLKASGLKSYYSLLAEKGFYSSEKIESWCEGILQKLLPNAGSPVKFKSLLIPTYVVSTDIEQRGIKVWSKDLTPEESVSRAVRASCSIPFFFQPVDGRYVDGGVLSNLPTFVFFDSGQVKRPLANRVLAFTLKSDEIASKSSSTLNYINSLVSTIIDGSQELQKKTHDAIQVVTISTGSIKATDFDKMNEKAIRTLIKNGENATRTFFDNELIEVRNARTTNDLCYGIEEMYATIVQNNGTLPADILIAKKDTKWVYALFPAILYWRTLGVKINVLLEGSKQSGEEAYRRNLLKHLGVNVQEIDAIPTEAFIFNPSQAYSSVAVVQLESSTHTQKITAVKYQGVIHTHAIRAIVDKLFNYFPSEAEEGASPRIAAGGHDKLLKRLKGVLQYSRPGVRLNIESISVGACRPLAHMVREFKYQQAQLNSEMFSKTGLECFEPAVVHLANGKESLLTPPIVEESNGAFCVIEGTSRVLYSWMNNIDKITCVVARGVQDPLPAEPTDLKAVRIIGRTLEADVRYKNFNYDFFRHIEKIVHDINDFSS